ncbi:MAG: SLC13/DASS family transporter [Bacteroidales bacterium]|nr:SLC13/DASS family transporter [Bacteroidales bacterium]
MTTKQNTGYLNSTKKWILLVVTLVATVVLWVLPTSSFHIDGLTVMQQRTMAIFVFAAMMWLFEVIPAWATSVTTIVALLFAVSDKGFVTEGHGVAVSSREIMASFADPVIMLFFGGFVLAIAASKVGLDAYLARTLLRIFGSKPKFVLLGLLLVPGIFSMFMSNTATAAMMLAFMAPVLKTLPKNSAAPAALTLAIPIAANFGGLGTPIGTPPNAIALGQLAKVGINISFGSWVIHMVPFVLLLLIIAWIVLMVLFPIKMDKLEINIEATDKFSRDFWIVAITFPVTILLWVTEGWTHFDSNIIALVPFAVFAITGVFREEDFGKIEWHILWMVAGGFALGTCLNETGLANSIINAIPFTHWQAIFVILGAGLIMYLLSTFISNSSAASLLMPVLAVVSTAIKGELTALGGAASLILYVAICCSLAMTLPISTPPNAIASSTGLVKTSDMVKVGLILGIIGGVLGYVLIRVFPF